MLFVVYIYLFLLQNSKISLGMTGHAYQEIYQVVSHNEDLIGISASLNLVIVHFFLSAFV